ncbi:hypothetical protein QVD17_01307 [Tagetes erecta]|uniref:Ribosome maturation factor RimP N-terminal domain-containing protein n=1 Tax=Tagetes erecta TaxID=13708 RepID=A0AAD8P883_TARER|nr:hypothetical protein QVD17_01307 [Tagetes erecta]
MHTKYVEHTSRLKRRRDTVIEMGSISLHHTILHFYPQSYPLHTQFLCFSKIPFRNSNTLQSSTRTNRCFVSAKNNNRSSEPLITPSIDDQLSEVDEFDEDDDGFEDDDDFEDDYLDEDAEPRFGDGGGGGGISLAGTIWDKEVLTIAEEVSLSFDGELGIYAFKTLQNSAIRVRIERLSNKSGSPSMEDIEAFSNAYRERLNQAEAAGTIPADISLEVSSPGLERVVRVPQDFGRFKDRPMYVKYTTRADDASSSSEQEGVLRLESFDLETQCCTWGLADVKVNREKAGKGRPLNKKQREWRVTTPFDSLLLVRIYADF